MKKLLLLTLLSLTIAAIDVTTKRVAFDVGPSITQIDFSDVLSGADGIFSLQVLYMDNFDSVFEYQSEINEDGEIEWYIDTDGQNLGIELEGSYDDVLCGISPKSIPGFVSCFGGEGGEDIAFLDKDYSSFSIWERDFEGCEGNLECDWQITGTMYADITGPFDDGIGSSDEIDDLQAQIDELVEQLTGCVDCEGDVSGNDLVNVQDIIILVEHIIDADTAGDCYSQ